jgi:hypothetical protein|tara:strand:- start:294 stop:572 length:279 start_codon:yes stop_codon:yes gene_type:complete
MSDKLAELAQAMAGSRQAVERTMIVIKTQLQTLDNRIRLAVENLERDGPEADLSVLGHLHEQGAAIDTLVRKLDEQKVYLEQALAYIKLSQR